MKIPGLIEELADGEDEADGFEAERRWGVGETGGDGRYGLDMLNVGRE